MIIRNATLRIILNNGRETKYPTGEIVQYNRQEWLDNIPAQVRQTSTEAPTITPSGALIYKYSLEVLVEARHLEKMKKLYYPCPFRVCVQFSETLPYLSFWTRCIAIEYLRAVSQYRLTCVRE